MYQYLKVEKKKNDYNKNKTYLNKGNPRGICPENNMMFSKIAFSKRAPWVEVIKLFCKFITQFVTPRLELSFDLFFELLKSILLLF